MQHKQIERKALTVGLVVNILMVAAGVIVFFITGLKAMFLDTAYTAISVGSGLVAIALSSHTVRTTERYPNGRFALEPIYAICKAVFTLTLLLFTLIDTAQMAYDYFAYGIGERTAFGPVVVYEAITVLSCLGLWLYYRRENHSIRGASTMLVAEEKSTFIDGAISLGIGAAAVLLVFLPDGTPLDFLHYTGDFFITLLIVLAVVKEPFGVLYGAYVELIGGVHEDDETYAFVEETAQRHLPDGTEYDRTLIFKTGMNYTIDVYLAGTGETIDVDNLVACKRALERELTRRLHIVDVDFVFD
ncbi:cobalt transporter [Bifidobacterium lemurum]|uniref:Cobalt transporter n=1 Tax=Bifidobacterium lemurum TaxID=1603886 RepID=A0A261FPG7_9BIFI|nr:cation transporter [Bifidobacterium lemurum]OZG60988.1 cobalt transporter [Bifidobacterium lemurum]QOL34782.1 cation transporter [Bifidobacterium lemurum]